MTDQVNPTGPQSGARKWLNTYLPITLILLIFLGLATAIFVDNNGDSIEAAIAIAGDMWHGPPDGYISLADLREQTVSGLAAFRTPVESTVHATGAVRNVTAHDGYEWSARHPGEPFYKIDFEYTGYNSSFEAYITQTDESTAFLRTLDHGSVIEIFGRGWTNRVHVTIYPVEMIRRADGSGFLRVRDVN